jgi:hypothetical protein
MAASRLGGYSTAEASGAALTELGGADLVVDTASSTAAVTC